jgi:hypothetical protein
MPNQPCRVSLRAASATRDPSTGEWNGWPSHAPSGGQSGFGRQNVASDAEIVGVHPCVIRIGCLCRPTSQRRKEIEIERMWLLSCSVVRRDEAWFSEVPYDK